MSKNLKDHHAALERVQNAIQTAVLGQEEVVSQMLVALLCNQHALLESVPGLGKTTMVKALADALKLDFSRVQNTPDLMPSDITGTVMVLERNGKQTFEFQEGPIFTNVLLADEINRATPKTQAAMLEAMAERQVTVAGETYLLDKPFFVLATQNPIDQEGTYPLPEAQTDRFLLKVIVGYPDQKAENAIVDMYGASESKTPKVAQTLTKDDVLKLQEVTRLIPISKDLQSDVITLVHATRNNPKYIKVGASPRASIGIVLAAKANALINGRNFATKKDVEQMATPVLRHRLILTFQAEQDGKDVDTLIAEMVGKTIKSK